MNCDAWDKKSTEEQTVAEMLLSEVIQMLCRYHKGTSTRSFRFLSVLCWQVIKSIHLDRKQIASLEILSHYCWLKPYGGRHVWSSFNEGSDKGEDERAPKRLSWWFEPALGLSILVTLATDPLSLMPCMPSFTCPSAHVFLQWSSWWAAVDAAKVTSIAIYR